MFGCLRRIGCLVILIIAAAAVWYWYARVPSTGSKRTAATANAGWEPLSQANAEAGRRGVESLSQRTGPVFANLTPAQAASYIFLVAAKTLPASAQKIE